MTPYYADDWLTVYQGDCRAVMAGMEPESVHCVVTSPPYWGLRDYGTATWIGGDEACDHKGEPLASSSSSLAGYTSENVQIRTQRMPMGAACRKCGAIRQDSQLGLEPTPEEYVANLVAVFREVKRVLRKDGTVWLNLGDSYVSNGRYESDRSEYVGDLTKYDHRDPRPAARGMGLKPKDLVGIPWRVAFALQADGWYLRSDIIWAKPNPMPESVTDRPTKSHEYVFLLSKRPTYFFDADAVREVSETRPQRRLTEVADQPGGDARLRAGGHNPMSQGGAPTKRDKQRATAAVSNPATSRRMAGFNDRWDASEDAGTAPLGRNIRSVWYDNGDETLQRVPARSTAHGVRPASQPDIWGGEPVQDVRSGANDGVAGTAWSAGEDASGEPQVRGDGGREGTSTGASGVGTPPSDDGRVEGVGGGQGGPASGEPVGGGQGSGGSVLRVGEGHRGDPSEAEDGARQGERRTVEAQAPDAIGWSVEPDGSRVGNDPDDAERDVRVLPPGRPVDDGPRSAAQPRRVEHDGECCRCVPPVQLQQEGADIGGVDRGGLTDLWTIATAPYPGAHFATFPPKLVEPCIKAGTSEKGVCPECGAPWERMAATTRVDIPGGSRMDSYTSPKGEAAGGTLRAPSPVRYARETTTTGWRPSCAHTAEPVPATCLDPFAGSGTTGMVAQSLSRRAVLIDLSLDYLGQLMARNRDIPLGLGA